MTARIEVNGRGIRELLNDPKIMDDVLRPRARAVLSAAKSAAPRQSGAYAASLEIVEGSTDRYRLAVGSPLPYATRVEARYGTLQGALDG